MTTKFVYCVFDNRIPACIEGSSDWDNNTFDTLEEGIAYAKAWIGDYTVPDDWDGSPHDYDGFGDKIAVLKKIANPDIPVVGNPWRDFKTDPPPEEEATLLVWLEEPLLHSRLRVASWHSNVKTIGCYFHFDCPKILKWKYANEFFPED